MMNINSCDKDSREEGSVVERIQKHLVDIEEKENISILFAVESGSRAWGFASPDSDYDVRFVYKRPLKEYLRLEKRRDVIEYMLNDELDINGWDIDKALRLLHTSNPTLMEWINSPIIYKKTPFLDELANLRNTYFHSKAGLYHYLSMAGRNYREYLRQDEVKLKKYFYVIRPLLACEWILANNTPPPMLFNDLLFLLPNKLNGILDRLIEMKVNHSEIKKGERIQEINDWIEEMLCSLEDRIRCHESSKKQSWKELNSLFLSELNIH